MKISYVNGDVEDGDSDSDSEEDEDAPMAYVVTDIFINEYMECLFGLCGTPYKYFQYRDDGFGILKDT